MKRPSNALLVAIAFSSFVALGIPGGALGVAWPSIRSSFALALDAVGTLLITNTIGYLVASFSNGRIIARLGVGPFLTFSSIAGGLGLLGYAVAPAWWVMVVCGLLSGLGSGAVDAGLNTYFAANHSPSLMNWLHACFGLGAALGPVVMATAIGWGYSWRWGYGVVVLLQVVLVLCFALTLKGWRLTPSGPAEGHSASSPRRMIDTMRLPAVWVSIGLFFVFTGLEGTGGQWPYTLFTEARSVDPSIASLWVSVYWASLTAGRIVSGVAVRYAGVARLLRFSTLGAICGTLMIWWNPTDAISFLGLALLGLSLAPMFPLSISNTPTQVGAGHAANAIGYQVAAASLGLAALPGLAGVLAKSIGLETIGPFLFLIAVVTLALNELSTRRVVPGDRA